MAQFESVGTNIWIHDNVTFGDAVSIGHCSCIGYGNVQGQTTAIGHNVRIGAFCVINLGATIYDNVEIDHYCRINSGSTIGADSKILYGVQVFDNVRVGERCIIGGDLADRTIVEDDVTFMGEIAHSHRQASSSLEWDSVAEPSPVICRGSVVGVHALIIGGVTIGPQSYIAAGEIVRADIPPRTVLYKGKLLPLERWRGIIRVRS